MIEAQTPVPARPPRRAVDGILLLDKPVGLTSNQALQRVKWLYRARKAGHTGSLDPLAGGLLPICFGQATKVSAFLLDADKTYTVTAAFGVATATGDAEGEAVAHSPVTAVARDALEAAMAGLQGEIHQVPPMYSALKQGGQRLYALARAGQQVPRAARPVTIHALELLHYDPSRPVLRVHCSKGTYIRTLVEDLAVACGTVGHVLSLHRSQVGPFDGQDMVALPGLLALADDLPALDAQLRPVDTALTGWPALDLGSSEAVSLSHGQPVNAGAGRGPGRVRLYGPGQRFLGIGEVLGDGQVAPRRLFV